MRLLADENFHGDVLRGLLRVEPSAAVFGAGLSQSRRVRAARLPLTVLLSVKWGRVSDEPDFERTADQSLPLMA